MASNATASSGIVKKVASLIKSGQAKNIVVLTGAGISCASGIPDFRSPGGMYDTLKPELLTASDNEKAEMKYDPTTVVSWDLFKNNQLPYLEVRRPFILGLAKRQWKPTLSHHFLSMLNDRQMLRRIYTQNIDGLDYQLDTVPNDKIIPVHGSLGRIECEFCKNEMDLENFHHLLETSIKDIYKLPNVQAPQKSNNILCPKCSKPGVKPATVLYGSSLPSIFFEKVEDDLPKCDLCIVIGTSLTVFPAASVPSAVSQNCPLVLINRDRVGDCFDFTSKRDFFLQGNCDEVVFDLITELGWLEDLKTLLKLSSPILCESAMMYLKKKVV